MAKIGNVANCSPFLPPLFPFPLHLFSSWLVLIGPLTNLINYVHDRGRYVGSDGDNFGVFSCGENDGENDGENTVKLL